MHVVCHRLLLFDVAVTLNIQYQWITANTDTCLLHLTILNQCINYDTISIYGSQIGSILNHLTNIQAIKSSSGDEIPERDMTYIIFICLLTYAYRNR